MPPCQTAMPGQLQNSVWWKQKVKVINIKGSQPGENAVCTWQIYTCSWTFLSRKKTALSWSLLDLNNGLVCDDKNVQTDMFWSRIAWQLKPCTADLILLCHPQSQGVMWSWRLQIKNQELKSSKFYHRLQNEGLQSDELKWEIVQLTRLLQQGKSKMEEYLKCPIIIGRNSYRAFMRFWRIKVTSHQGMQNSYQKYDLSKFPKIGESFWQADKSTPLKKRCTEFRAITLNHVAA